MNYLKKSFAFLTIIPVLLSSCSQLGKIVAEGITEPTNSLKGIACSAYYVNNLYSKNVNSSSIENLGKVWKEGDNALMLTLAKKHGVGLYKLNGDISVDNEPIPYIMAGSYVKTLAPEDLKPKTITLKTKNGEEAYINIDAPKPFNLISVNGSKDEPEVDLNKDLYLEFDNFKNLDKNERLKVSFVMDVLGVREFVDIGIFKPTKMLKIPSFAFKNLSVTASASGVAELKPGKNFIKVERFNIKKDKIDGFAASQAVSMSWSTMPVELIGNSLQNQGLTVKGETGNNETYLGYNINKPNAFYGKPISKIKKLALYSLSVRGLLRDVQSFTSTSTSGNVTTTTTTKIIRQFPKLPDSYWEQLMENSYKDISKTLKDLNIELIPVQKVTSSKEYGFLEEINDVNNEREIVKKYKNTKTLMATSLAKIIENTSSTFANDRPEVRLIDELGVDGLIGVAVDLAVDRKSDLIKLIPRLSIKLIGGANGYTVGPVTYATGYVSGSGTSFSESEFSNINALNRITRKDDMIKLLSKGLKEMIKKEKEAGYDSIWSLQ
jgi:hypothetical protein